MNLFWTFGRTFWMGGWVWSRASTYTGQHNTEKRGHTYPCLEWDSKPRS